MLLPLLMLILFTAPTHTSQPVNTSLETQIGNRSLIIAFDPHLIETPNTIVTFSRLLSKMIRDKSGPLLISHNLWDIIVSSPEFLKTTSFNRAEWQVYTTQDNAMLLFIPLIDPFISYLALLKDTKNTSNQTNISTGEFLLGFKINHLQPINNPLSLLKYVKPQRTIDSLKKYLEEVLVTYADVKHIGTTYLNRWDIVLMGHGFSAYKEKGLISGMHVSSFEMFLDFLNQKIQTRTLFYISCYSGGKNLKKPYRFSVEHQEERDKDFNFIIISGSMFDLELKVDKNFSANIGFNTYFKKLNDYFKGIRTTSLANIIKEIRIGTLDLSLHKKISALHMPTIRFPHTGWFKITDIDARVFTLDNSVIMRAINQSKNKIIVPGTTELVLLDTRYIPIPVIIEGTSMPLLTPQDVHQTAYFFKEIIARSINLIGSGTDFQTMLSTLKIKMSTAGNFYIEKLVTKLEYQYTQNGALGWGSQPLTFSNVIINPNNFIELTYNGKPYTYIAEKNLWQRGSYQSTFIASSKKENVPEIPMPFLQAKETIRQESTLPASMKSDNPTPIVSLSLFQKYMALKEKPQKEEGSKMDRLLRFLREHHLAPSK